MILCETKSDCEQILAKMNTIINNKNEIWKRQLNKPKIRIVNITTKHDKGDLKKCLLHKILMISIKINIVK